MKLKVLTVILSVILVFSCIPFSASAFMIWEEDPPIYTNVAIIPTN